MALNFAMRARPVRSRVGREPRVAKAPTTRSARPLGGLAVAVAAALVLTALPALMQLGGSAARAARPARKTRSRTGLLAGDSAASWWQPGPLTSWAYVIGENYPLAVPTNIGNVQVYDADLGDQSGLSANGAPLANPTIEASVAAIHASGAHAICYVDAGTAENWRSDYPKFDPSELGGPMPGWPGEQFINVADWSAPVPAPYETLQTIMANRIALCKQEGFDAIEADNVDAYTSGSLGNFTLTMAQEETYIDELISMAHSDGLAYFLKNEINGDSLLTTEAPLVDGEINEQCWQYKECSALSIFAKEGKPILNVEYQSFPASTLCPEALAFPMATIQTGINLNGKINYGCWQYAAGTGGTTTTSPVATAPVTTAPATAPVTTAPGTTAPVTTAPVTTAPVTTVPVTTAPVTTAPVTPPAAPATPVPTPPAATPSATAAPPTTQRRTTKRRRTSVRPPRTPRTARPRRVSRPLLARFAKIVQKLASTSTFLVSWLAHIGLSRAAKGPRKLILHR